MDKELMREYIRTIKEEKRRRSSAKIGKVLGALGKAVPKGVRHPDSLIRNLHLYKPGVKGRTRLR